ASNRRTVILPNNRGKATALNCGVAEAKGEIVVFTDARQTIASGALRNLVANYADPSVGCVSGELIIPSSQGASLYWRLEKKIRYWEGLAGSTVGASGALYAVRRNLLLPLPQETILDDVYIPFQVVRQGQRVIFEPMALALALQVTFYALAALSIFRAKVGIVARLSDISLAFLVLNTAAAVAFIYFVTGRKVVWAR